VDFDDINAFVLKLSTPEAWYLQYDCETCPARAAGGEHGAARLPEDPYAAAEVFLVYLADDQLETFVAMVEQLVAHYADTPRGEFWSAVLEVLHAAQ